MTLLHITDIEHQLREAGHHVERIYEPPEGSLKPLSESQWYFRVDGQVVATGAAIGDLEENVRRWMAGMDESPR